MMRYLKNGYLAAIYAVFYIPIIILIVFSFNNSAFSLQWHGATLSWYQTLFSDYDLMHIAGNSLLVAVLAASIATCIGTLGAVALYRYQFFAKKSLTALVFILIVAPDLVMGIALLMLFYALHVSLGFWTLLLAHITFCLPFVVVVVTSRLEGSDKNLFEAAKDLGATDYIVFRRIILPMLVPAVIAGWLLSFTLSMDDVVISFFVTGPGFQILPLYIYSSVRVEVTPEINALCTIMFLLTIVLLAISQFVMRKRT